MYRTWVPVTNGPAGEADAGGEEGFTDALGVGGIVTVDGLPVHGFPEEPGLDIGRV